MSLQRGSSGVQSRMLPPFHRWRWSSGKIIILLLMFFLLTPSFSVIARASTSPALAIDQPHLDSISQTLRQKIQVTHHSPGQSGATTQVKPGVTAPVGGNLPPYNNVGTSDDGSPGSANFDGSNGGYSAQALAAAGVVPGQYIQVDGVNFTWPSASAGSLNNYVVSSQVIPVTPVLNATTLAFLGASSGAPVSGTATITYTDNSTQTFTLGMSGWTLEGGKDQISYGNLTAATMSYHNAPAGKQTVTTYLFYSSVDMQAGKTIQSVTLPATGSQGQLHIFAVSTRARYNNVGSSDDSTPRAGNFDGGGASYSNQALAKDGLVAGQNITYNGTTFTWPNVAVNNPNDYQAIGQNIPITPVANATTVGFLGAASNGQSSGTATLTYTDGTTQTFTLSMSDWTLGAGRASLALGDSLAFSMTYRNTATTSQVVNTYIFYTEVSLQTGKTLQSITMPSTGNTQGALHIFAIGTRNTQVAGYNNVGTSDDSSPTTGNLDGNGFSYSAQALQAAGLTPGKQLSYDGIFFTWPNVPAGSANNYLANGQTIPVTPVAQAVEIGFLGMADNASSSSGTATLTYSDGSTQTITLGFTNWLTTGTPAFGNAIIATSAYYHTPTATQHQNAYVFGAEFSLQVGKVLQSVSLPSSLSQGQLHVFAIGTRSYFNNIGISDDTNPSVANFDMSGNSYSSQEITDPNYMDWQPCDDLNYFGMDFTWPCVSANTPDNYQAQGQTIPVTSVANADTIGFVGASSNGPSSGTAIINYTDGSTQSFTLGMSDWTLNGFTQAPSYQNRLFAALKHRNTPTGQQTLNVFIFYAEQKLQPGKTVQSVTLPSTVNQGQLHIFSIATGVMGGAPNSVGVSLDESTIFANYDGANRSYSEEALKTAGVYPGQSFFFNGIQFNWTEGYSAIPDSYIAQGQTIPVTPVPNADTLAFVGAADHGSAVGLATITYTDGTTQSFTLGLTDWFSSTINYGNLTVANMPYHNTATGKETGATYLYYADTPLQPGKTLQSVTLPATTSPGRMHIFSIGTRGPSPYNNVGMSDDADPIGGNYDGVGKSWSVEALQSVGITPGATLTYNGVNFTWPSVQLGSFDNYQASGQTIPVTPVANANTLAFLGSASYGPSSGTATITYTDGSTQTFTLGFTDWINPAPSFGNLIAAVTPYANSTVGRVAGNHYLYYAETSLQSGKTVQSVTLPTTVNQGQLHVFAVGTRAGVYYNNAGISDDAYPAQGFFDNTNDSYSAEALKNTGVAPGQQVGFDGIPFMWPNVPTGSLDNYRATGQTIAVTPVANEGELGFLGAATNGPSSGTATITYTDGSTQSFTLGFSDWLLGAGNNQPVSPSFGNITVATTSYVNAKSGTANYKGYVFGAEVAIPAGKTVQSVTLPSSVNQGAMHIFAIGVRSASVYNNAGTSDDASPTTANYDGGQTSWSVQALQSVGVTPGASLTYNGVNFTWPNVPSAGLNNYQASGQTIPVTPVANANTLAFLGTATNGPSSGTATITYTDGTTQTFTLGFTDWWNATASFNNTMVAVVPYVNTPTGKVNSSHYLYYAETSLQAGKTVQSVTLPTTVNQGHLHVFAVGTRAGVYYNNAGISGDAYPAQSFFDNGTNSYSAEALKKAYVVPGQTVAFDGIPFTWPNVPSGALDNYVANGQTIAVASATNEDKLGFLGAAAYGPTSGVATITYTDGSTQTFTLGFSDWQLGAGNGQPVSPSFGNTIVATTSYINGKSGTSLNAKGYVFGAEVAIPAGKTVQSVTLPSSVNQGVMHIFAIGVRSANLYNNAGISDDAHPAFANFDGQGTVAQGDSYSDQALQAAGFSQGKTVTYNGVTFTWPNESDGLFDNYQANGQTIPVTPVANATTLAFLGASTHGSSTGTGTITYTDGSTQSFTLSLTDWAVSPSAYGNLVATTMSYRNTPTGKQTINVYVFYTDVTLQAGKTVQSVQLPSSGSGGQLHVFAIGTK